MLVFTIRERQNEDAATSSLLYVTSYLILFSLDKSFVM